MVMFDDLTQPTIENTQCYDVPYWGDNDEIRSAIVFVLQNVPESVRDFARQQCIFTSMDENKIVSTSFKLPERPLIPHAEIWLIALSEHILY